MWNSSKCDFNCQQASKTDEYLTLFRMGLFGAGHGSGGAKSPPPFWNLSHIPNNNETWHTDILPKEDPKNI